MEINIIFDRRKNHLVRKRKLKTQKWFKYKRELLKRIITNKLSYGGLISEIYIKNELIELDYSKIR